MVSLSKGGHKWEQCRSMARSKQKIEAIYELRDAAEKKAKAEAKLQHAPSSETRDALLDAQMALEEKTLQAIEVCHECGHPHLLDQPRRTTRQTANVYHVNFEGNKETRGNSPDAGGES
jgi:hypothetical protein